MRTYTHAQMQITIDELFADPAMHRRAWQRHSRYAFRWANILRLKESEDIPGTGSNTLKQAKVGDWVIQPVDNEGRVLTAPQYPLVWPERQLVDECIVSESVLSQGQGQRIFVRGSLWHVVCLERELVLGHRDRKVIIGDPGDYLILLHLPYAQFSNQVVRIMPSEQYWDQFDEQTKPA